MELFEFVFTWWSNNFAYYTVDIFHFNLDYFQIIGFNLRSDLDQRFIKCGPRTRIKLEGAMYRTKKVKINV